MKFAKFLNCRNGVSSNGRSISNFPAYLNLTSALLRTRMCLYFVNVSVMEDIAFLSMSEMKMGNFQ